MVSEILYADDLKVGDRFEFGSYTPTADEIVEFALQWDPQEFHTDAAVAEAGAYGGLIASGLHTMSIYQRLSVQAAFATWSVIAGRRLRDVMFLRPVRPGDTLTGALVIDDIESGAGRAVVTTSTELVNATGKPVLTVVVEVLVRARPA